MPNILKRPQAITDLYDIWEYIAEDSDVRADNFIDRIDQKICNGGVPGARPAREQ